MSNNVEELFKDWLAWTAQLGTETGSNAKASTSTHIRASALQTRERTDRSFGVSLQDFGSETALETPAARPLYSRAARAEWLQKYDIRTEMLDGGVGCCWFAQQGEDGLSVCGQTEEEAIGRLARENGIPWRNA